MLKPAGLDANFEKFFWMPDWVAVPLPRYKELEGPPPPIARVRYEGPTLPVLTTISIEDIKKHCQ